MPNKLFPELSDAQLLEQARKVCAVRAHNRTAARVAWENHWFACVERGLREEFIRVHNEERDKVRAIRSAKP